MHNPILWGLSFSRETSDLRCPGVRPGHAGGAERRAGSAVPRWATLVLRLQAAAEPVTIPPRSGKGHDSPVGVGSLQGVVVPGPWLRPSSLTGRGSP